MGLPSAIALLLASFFACTITSLYQTLPKVARLVYGESVDLLGLGLPSSAALQ